MKRRHLLGSAAALTLAPGLASSIARAQAPEATTYTPF